MFAMQLVAYGSINLDQSNEKIILTNNCPSDSSELKLEIIKNNYYLSCSNESVLNTIDPSKIKAIRIITDPQERKMIMSKLDKISTRIKGNIIIIELLE